MLEPIPPGIITVHMPTLAQNLQTWDRDWDWSSRGEEWSDWWGSADAQWKHCIFPRISDLRPSGTILEIGPGFGRWTGYLGELATDLIAVDISPRCIEACRGRFAEKSNVTFFVNDGLSLDMVQDRSIDFVFSFDSLVHAEADAIGSYISALGRKLSANGRGFIHHSNWRSYRGYLALLHFMPRSWRSDLIRRGVLDSIRWRAGSMSAALFRQQCIAAGLHCTSQELVNWGTRRLGDCFSVFTRRGSDWDNDTQVVRNPRFMQEASRIREALGD